MKLIVASGVQSSCGLGPCPGRLGQCHLLVLHSFAKGVKSAPTPVKPWSARMLGFVCWWGTIARLLGFGRQAGGAVLRSTGVSPVSFFGGDRPEALSYVAQASRLFLLGRQAGGAVLRSTGVSPVSFGGDRPEALSYVAQASRLFLFWRRQAGGAVLRSTSFQPVLNPCPTI